MKKFFKKNERGFTLAELLIVVAIIGVLVAVSIPIFTVQLEKARESTDLANLRAAYAAGTAAYLESDAYAGGYYDIGTGGLVAAGTKAGKGTDTVGSDANAVKIGGFTYAPGTAYTDQFIKVTVTNGVVTVAFSAI